MSIFTTVNDLALLMANDLATPIVSLVELSRSQDPKVLKALVENPNTPPDVLRILSPRFPNEFLRNPVLPMLLLESPDYFRRFTIEQLHALIFRRDFPRFILLDLQAHPNPRVVLAAHRALLGHPETATIELEWVSDKDSALRRSAASSPKAPAKVLEVLLCDPNVGVRIAAARNKTAPKEFLSLLRRAGANDDLSSFTTPGRVSREELQELSTRGPFARALWVRHPQTPAAYAKIFSCYHDQWWLAALASRPDLPADTLDRIKAGWSFPYLDKELRAREAREKAGAIRGRRDK